MRDYLHWFYTIYHYPRYSKYVFGQSWTQEDVKGQHKVKSRCGILRDQIILGGLHCGPSVHLTSHLGNAASHLVQEQEDYIWRGIRFLKTKGCVFRLLPISPLRLFCSRVANVFTRDAGGVFLISSPLSLRFPLCHDSRIVWGGKVCGRVNEGKLCPSFRATMWKFNVRLWVFLGGG